MKSIGDLGYVYQPWSDERRQAARKAAMIRIYGSEKRAAKAHALMARRDKLRERLDAVEAEINKYRSHMR